MVLRRAESERRAGVRWFVAGYAGLAGFLALEAVVREGGTASSLDKSDEDHATTRMILAAYAAAVTRLADRAAPSVAAVAAGCGAP